MKTLDTLQTDIITWASTVNSKILDKEQETIYRKCIEEEFSEFINAPTPDNEYNEIMDLLWVIIIFCHIKHYSIPLGLEALLQANNTKLINPQYNEFGKLLKGSNYVRPDWKKLLEESKMES